MDKDIFKVTVFGARGSMSVSGRQFDKYGGETSCYMVEAGDECIFLDAGSGLVGAPTQFKNTPVILLSHLHLDHLLGLGMYPRLSKKGMKTDIYVPTEGTSSARDFLDRLYSPPFWPLSIANYAGDISVKKLEFPMHIGDAEVLGIEGNHPGGCIALRINYHGRSLVYLTDYEYEEGSVSRIIDFVKGADLIMFDGQYTDEEYKTKTGFGHSTASMGINLIEKAGCKRMLVIHHDPLSTDEELEKRAREIGRTDVSYACAGEVIDLMSSDVDNRIKELEEENRELKEKLAHREEFIHNTVGRYLTEEVLNWILNNKDPHAIGGERKIVTMLFCDLRNSTDMSESMHSSDFLNMLNHFLSVMISLINAWNGNILEFVGDAIVVVFGAPQPNETAARDAVACAVSMQRRMPAVNLWNAERGYPEISMGIGIHTGEAILGNIGSNIRTKYDMIGRNVNLTSRIEGFTKGGQILISPETYEAAGEGVIINPDTDMWVNPKGIQEKIHLYDVTGFGSKYIP